MLWKESVNLKELKPSSKIGVTAFLILCGVGYLLGFANIYLTYSPVDQKPGLSLNDISDTFYGLRETTRLESSIDGSMREYFAADQNYNLAKSWIQEGAKESEFETVKAVLDPDCNICHSEEAQVADVVLVSFEDVETYLTQDTGKTPGRLVSLSHTHLLATIPIILLLALVFSITSFPEIVKVFVISFSFLAIVLDIGSWWLAKLAPGLAVLVVISGASLGLSFFLLVVLPLYEIWLKPKKE